MPCASITDKLHRPNNNSNNDSVLPPALALTSLPYHLARARLAQLANPRPAARFSPTFAHPPLTSASPSQSQSQSYTQQQSQSPPSPPSDVVMLTSNKPSPAFLPLVSLCHHSVAPPSLTHAHPHPVPISSRRAAPLAHVVVAGPTIMTSSSADANRPSSAAALKPPSNNATTSSPHTSANNNNNNIANKSTKSNVSNGSAVTPRGTLDSSGTNENGPANTASCTSENRSRDYHGIPNPAPGQKLTLPDLRERLIRQEETIIFSLIERAQFRMNDVIYKPGAFTDLPDYSKKSPTLSSKTTNPTTSASENVQAQNKHAVPVSFSQYMLYELERCHARVRRYTSPDEHPFAPAHILPPPVLPPLNYPPTLVANDINYNAQIEGVYQSSILPSICEAGDDQNYGSSATCDAACLQALSKRIHYGKFIAEAKCQGDEATYERLARAGDRQGIWDLLTDVKVEDIVYKRVENKARNYGSGGVMDAGPRDEFKVDPVVISNLYRDFIIPLTKDVEVDYILQRYGAC